MSIDHKITPMINQAWWVEPIHESHEITIDQATLNREPLINPQYVNELN